MNFTSALKNTLNEDYNVSVTENGAVGYRTTGKELLDLNFSVASLRSASEAEITSKFVKAFFEDKMAAMKWLFFARDVRGGLGERRLFRTVMKYLADNLPEYVRPVIELVAEYGRYDDLLCLLDTGLDSEVYPLIEEQLDRDLKSMKDGQPISLLAKWLPSPGASSATTKRYAKQIQKVLGATERQYRKMLSELRGYLDIVEKKMSAKQWGEIKYEAVPSRANLIYNKAFLRNDEERRRAYLESLAKGETKINAGTLFPHEIVHKYGNSTWNAITEYNETLEQLWKALPDTVNGNGNTIVVADGSGSMTCDVDPHSSVTALDVANALAIYFAEHSSGQFKDKYITFSGHPRLVDFSKAKNLREKLMIAKQYNEMANTNIEAVFNLILTTAVNNRMRQEDMPQNVLIISDMEFDTCAICGSQSDYWSRKRPDSRLFNVIRQRYEAAGYKLPRLVFWNVNSRTGTIPVKENDLGVALVSGFSQNVASMVMSGKLDPYECLMETLNSERYQPVEKALEGLV